MSHIRRFRLRSAALVAVLAGGLLGGTATAHAQTRLSQTGWIDGAEFRVEVPEHWNGTLVLFSHGYFPPGFDPPGVALANSPETEGWLLDHGYALAASDFNGVSGATYEQAFRDQAAVLDWFDTHVGRPRQTVALGASSGGALSVMLSERNPRRFAGVASLCAPFDLQAAWNTALDVDFALKTLLAPSAELVHVQDPPGSTAALQNAVSTAMGSKEGRARLALAAAFGNVPGWVTADAPRPVDPNQAVLQQARQLLIIHTSTFGPGSRGDLESRAGGNPSWNLGIDYRDQLARSPQRDLVLEAYRLAGPEVNLDADLATLAAAPRIKPDLPALFWMYRFGVPWGTTPAPVITLHNVADSAELGHERWYASQIQRHGDPTRLRQLYIDRPGHCTFSAAEEIVVLRTLFTRITTHSWPAVDPSGLNTAAATFTDPTFHKALDLATFQNVPVSPAFTTFTPPQPMRPSI